ncbi:hypothetical protein IPJ70_01670 [Candidatus Campbellbacteria bacterium]|nr:MAG: hypothetical protein IPJ70_01670 [Candidatus Campbellbacteria bacterium]
MRKKIFIILVVVIVVLIGVSFLKKGSGVKIPGVDTVQTTSLSEKDVQSIVAMLGKHIKIPNETPDIRIVEDASLTQGVPFLQNAKNGDILLIYPSISRAILFDLKNDIIINVGPVVLENPEGGPTTQTSTATDTAQ